MKHRIKVLAAAFPALNRVGEGSSPSGPTDNKHWSSSGQDSAPVMRIRRFESGPVLSLFDNLVVLAEQPGVLATLSRWRSSVQIRSGTPFRLDPDSAVRKLAKRRSSNLRGLWVRLPPVLLTCVGWALARCLVCTEEIG